MSTQHTPEPWLFARNDSGTWEIGLSEGYEDAGGGVCGCGCGENGEYLRVTVSGHRAEHDARRIVACVNACKGINPDAVPELLEALGRFIDEIPAQVDIGILSVKTQALKAISKAKGVEP